MKEGYLKDIGRLNGAEEERYNLYVLMGVFIA